MIGFWGFLAAGVLTVAAEVLEALDTGRFSLVTLLVAVIEVSLALYYLWRGKKMPPTQTLGD